MHTLVNILPLSEALASCYIASFFLFIIAVVLVKDFKVVDLLLALVILMIPVVNLIFFAKEVWVQIPDHHFANWKAKINKLLNYKLKG